MHPLRRGFTLIELLIVVAIIAILAAIAVPNFLEAQTRSKVARVKADMRSLATAIEAYYVDNNRYPSIVATTAGPGQLNGFSVFFPSVRGVSSRFICLTTPISYTTSVFRDGFIPPSAQFAFAPTATGRNPLDGYDTYDYVDAKSFTPGGAPLALAVDGAARCSGASWHTVSSGPDQRNAFGGGVQGGGGYQPNLGMDYDPTNGTISAGDIVRIGSGPGPRFAGKNPTYDRVNNKFNL